MADQGSGWSKLPEQQHGWADRQVECLLTAIQTPPHGSDIQFLIRHRITCTFSFPLFPLPLSLSPLSLLAPRLPRAFSSSHLATAFDLSAARQKSLLASSPRVVSATCRCFEAEALAAILPAFDRL